jgi:hypothetical protein
VVSTQSTTRYYWLVFFFFFFFWGGERSFTLRLTHQKDKQASALGIT